ncbi:TonB-dependent receptor [Simiduia curdlanivorans]|uniref:TonB-dependent receptor n=1 Tax=Simiduia curdlanivorans TaxID=1492769 RepID=A0ABV8V993_9GAMM|nr:TonB-dependent receptor [Simiduia curdlanivorans]MDN3638467.1 TonB-dependent receptor [Simiduia curdlanivorans]
MFKPRLLSQALAMSAVSLSAPHVLAQDAAIFDIEEVIVTATRRAEGVQDIPYNITAVNGEALRELGATSLSKMAQFVPGMQMVDAGARGTSLVTLRGMNIGGLQASENQGGKDVISRYVNDTPLLIDFKLIDIERIEVLRGPQGTLYGRGAMGGTVRYILNKPSTEAFEGEVYGKMSQNAESDSLSYETNAIVNIPLSETVAARFAVGYLDDAGFIDYTDVLTQPGISNNSRVVKDANNEQTTSARASLRWEPTEEFYVQANYFVQDQDAGARQAGNELYTGNKYHSAMRYVEPYEAKDQLANVEFDWKTDYVEIFSTTSLASFTGRGQRDQTDLLVVDIWPGYADFPEFSAFTQELDDVDTLVHETRFLSTGDGAIDWIAGIYYENEESEGSSTEYTPGYQDWAGIDTGWGEVEYLATNKDTFTEKAVFGEVTWHITDAMQVTGGLRRFEQTLNIKEDCTLLAIYNWNGTPGDATEPECDSGKGSVKDSVGKLNVSYDLTEDMMVYGTWAEGFRRGGVNIGPGLLASEKTYAPDKATNYELGLRSTWVDGRVTANAALFQIDWSDLQVPTKSQENALNITKNGQEGQIRGVELTLQAYATERLRLDGWITFYDTQLTEDAPEINGLEGDAFPGVPELQFNLAADYSIPLGAAELVLRGNYYWKDSVATQLNDTIANNGDYVELDSYGLLNLSADYVQDQWNVKLFIDNATNEYYENGARGEARYGDRGSFRYVGNPRMIGLEAGYRF